MFNYTQTYQRSSFSFCHLFCHIFCGTMMNWNEFNIQPLCTSDVSLVSTLCIACSSHLISVLCLFYKFAWPFCLISFNLKVRHSAPSSSLMVHVLILHLEKLDIFFLLCLFVFNSWVVMHSGKCPCIPKCVVRCCSFRLVKHAVMLISYHFLLIFLVSFSLCMNGSSVRVPLIIDLQSHNTNKDPHF